MIFLAEINQICMQVLQLKFQPSLFSKGASLIKSVHSIKFKKNFNNLNKDIPLVFLHDFFIHMFMCDLLGAVS